MRAAYPEKQATTFPFHPIYFKQIDCMIGTAEVKRYSRNVNQWNRKHSSAKRKPNSNEGSLPWEAGNNVSIAFPWIIEQKAIFACLHILIVLDILWEFLILVSSWLWNQTIWRILVGVYSFPAPKITSGNQMSSCPESHPNSIHPSSISETSGLPIRQALAQGLAMGMASSRQVNGSSRDSAGVYVC